MKKYIFTVSVLLLSASALFSQTVISGISSTSTRLKLFSGSEDFSFSQNGIQGTIGLNAIVDNNLSAFTTISYVYYGAEGIAAFNSINESSIIDVNSLSFSSLVSPVSLSIHEAYFSYTDFIFPKLELSLGKQFLSMGRADKLRPTDILCPSDLSDPFAFGKKLAVISASLKYELPVFDGLISLYYVPVSGIAILPSFFSKTINTELNPVFLPSANTAWKETTKAIDIELQKDAFTKDKSVEHKPLVIDLQNWTGKVLMPKAQLDQGAFALKAQANIWGIDFSCNIARRISDIPYIKSVSFSETSNIYLGIKTKVLSTLTIEETTIVIPAGTQLTIGPTSVTLPDGTVLNIDGSWPMPSSVTTNGNNTVNIVGNTIVTTVGNATITTEGLTEIQLHDPINIPEVNTISTESSMTQSYLLSYGGEWELGFDAVKDFGFLMSWFECGLFFPELAETQVSVNGLITVIKPMSMGYIVQNVNASTEGETFTPYFKYTLGIDKNFDGGFYTNIQLSHGFASERGESGPFRSQDYLIALFSKKFLQDKLTLSFTNAFNLVSIFDAVSSFDILAFILNNSAVLLDLNTEYKVSDSLAFTVGYNLLLANENSKANLARIKNEDSLYLGFSYSY